MSRFPEVVTARATRAERKIIDAAAAEAGETVSEFVRRTTVREARRRIGGDPAPRSGLAREGGTQER